MAQYTSAPPRRRIVFVNRLEDRTPGRVAFVVHRGRRVSRTRSLDVYRRLHRWARLRHARLVAELLASADSANQRADRDAVAAAPGQERAGEGQGSVAAADSTDQQDDAGSDDLREPEENADETPNESWTKGRLYELAREMDIDGRSKLNKAELLETILEHR